MAHNYVNSAQHYSKDNMPNIPMDKRKCTLLVMGLPYNVNKQQVYDFFQGYDIIDREVHMLTTHSG
jgi:RNA recognition motif-containing protein